MTQHPFGQAGGGGSIDPNDLNMAGSYGHSMQNNIGSNPNNFNSGFTSGSAQFQDDELMDALSSPMESGMRNGGQDLPMSMSEMHMGGYGSSNFNHPQGLHLETNQVNGFSSTPDGDPIQSPYIHGLQYRQMHQGFASMQTPGSYAGSPLAGADFNNDGSDANYLKARSRMSQAMQRKTSNTRSPLTKNSMMGGATAGSAESFGAQPIRSNGHEKSQSGQWIQTPNSMSSFPGSGFSSPLQAGAFQNQQQLNEMLRKGGASMPANLNTTTMTSTQEAKKKRRRESHNLVERRRRDNINERIQDLSKLVPPHRLEDEKIKKLIASGTPLSPTLTGLSAPTQATSSLAGPGARRATGAGSITTGLPLDDKDKGPNKGDILNGAVSWMRDLMWLLNVQVARLEEIADIYSDRGEALPYTVTDDERRMISELIGTMRRSEAEGDQSHLSYSRTNGTGLRVPDYTDYKGDPMDGTSLVGHHTSVSPDDGSGVMVNELLDDEALWGEDDGSGDLDIKEHDEFMEF